MGRLRSPPRELAPAGAVVQVQGIKRATGGDDTITASGTGENYLIGGAGKDALQARPVQLVPRPPH